MANHCAECRYFYQHYIYDPKLQYRDNRWGYIPIQQGHCVHVRVKMRYVFESCEAFERRDER